jgi:hypothetical protein
MAVVLEVKVLLALLKLEQMGVQVVEVDLETQVALELLVKDMMVVMVEPLQLTMVMVEAVALPKLEQLEQLPLEAMVVMELQTI